MIAKVADVCDVIAKDLAAFLSERHGHEGTEDLYGSDVRYEEREPDFSQFHNMWDEPRKYQETFHNIFSGLPTDLSYCDDSNVIREIGPNDEDRFVWRARIACSSSDIEAMARAPDREIGPPPSHKTKGGRMNAPGCPAFYGSMDQETCVAEVRPPVGSHVVLARFELTKFVSLLDLDKLAHVYAAGVCHFDPDYTTLQGRAAFLRRLASEISRPVMPQDEAQQYAVTQAFADYLAYKLDSEVRPNPGIDGVIYPSSQTDGAGRNLVLFNHACKVEPYNLPEGTYVECDVRAANEDTEGDECEEITVYERVSPAVKYETLTDSISAPDECGAQRCDEPSVRHEPTLRIDVESVYVRKIRSVCYDSTRCAVNRIRVDPSRHIGA